MKKLMAPWRAFKSRFHGARVRVKHKPPPLKKAARATTNKR